MSDHLGLGVAPDELERLAGIGTWVADPTFRHSHWSSSFARILGLEPTAPTPPLCDFLAMVHVEDRDRVADSLVHLPEHDGDPVEFRLVRRDGAVSHLHLVTRVVREPDGSRTAHRILQDVTADRVLQAQLAAERDRATAVLAALPEAYLFQQFSVVLETSDAVLAMTGFARDEILGSCPPPFIAPADADRWVRPFPDDAGPPTETLLRRKDGSRFPALVSVRPARGTAGTVCGYVTTLEAVATA